MSHALINFDINYIINASRRYTIISHVTFQYRLNIY
jgi:hypothetical protein